ncbi:MAG TPA: serpin family protein [Oculatellaceae cyanobacterium]
MRVRSRYCLLLPLALALSLPAFAEVTAQSDKSPDSRNLKIDSTSSPAKPKAKPAQKPDAKSASTATHTKPETPPSPESKPGVKADAKNEPKPDTVGKVDVEPKGDATTGSAAEVKDDAVKIDLAHAENAFGLAAYKKLGDGGKNLFMSPFSIHSCLHLVFDGAGGATEEEMAKVLHLSVAGKEVANTEYVRLLEEIEPATSDEPFVFSAANSVWANKDLKLRSGFVDTAKSVFRAEVRSLDFANSESVGTINSWVSDNTHGKIPKIVDSLTPEQAMVAVNAAYFKAPWKTVFNRELTKEADFKTDSGTKKVSMMDVRGAFHYLENDELQAIELTYGGGRESCIVILPKEKSTLGELRQSLTSTSWDALVDKMGNRSGELFLPKFTLEYQVPLRDYLIQAGMKQAFEKNADFSRIAEAEKGSPACAKLSQVLHKTFLKVNEEGTEAAAATATTERMLSLDVQKEAEPFKMVVNRPFFFAIVNWKTRAILFLGQVADPGQDVQ